MNMNETPKRTRVVPYDAAQFLTSEEAICAYLNEALQNNDPQVVLMALRDVARARGVHKIAQAAGVGRESLYKSLAKGAKPRYETVHKLLRAAGFDVVAVPRATA